MISRLHAPGGRSTTTLGVTRSKSCDLSGRTSRSRWSRLLISGAQEYRQPARKRGA
jgi:hypothetical protein